MEIDFGVDSKLLKRVQETIKATHDNCSLFLAFLDVDSSRISVNAFVSKQHGSQGLDARQWCEYCTNTLGLGKGGGKADLASASFSSPHVTVSEILSCANTFFKQTILD